jgi:LPS-assembly lipoprotein
MTVNKCSRWLLTIVAAGSITLLVGCGFHLRGEMPLAPPLHNLYVQSIDPYGTLVRILEQSLKMSNVHLAANSSEANTILTIIRDDTAQDLLSVGGSQQTRQYKLSVIVAFEVTDNSGRILVEPQTLVESRVITVQSNQILGSSNEANLYFQQMRGTLASAIMYRLSSHEITKTINQAVAANAQAVKLPPEKNIAKP